MHEEIKEMKLVPLPQKSRPDSENKIYTALLLLATELLEKEASLPSMFTRGEAVVVVVLVNVSKHV